MPRTTLLCWLLLLTACAGTSRPELRVAPLGSGEGLSDLRESFRQANPGYDIEWLPDASEWRADGSARVGFVQRGPGQVRVLDASGGTLRQSAVDVGDILVLRAGESCELEGALDVLAFCVPSAPPEAVPAVIRTDWDPAITDTPGGCAEETGAYRRILLTWLTDVGPYVYRAINAHRVRITDSFTHYHPREGGFDEFYLVQMTQPGALLLTSRHVGKIESGEPLSDAEAEELFDATELHVGDLIYLPRGLAHRGLGGALVQVITVPGFRPGAEIGLDHHLRKIDAAHPGTSVPYHAAAAAAAVIK